MKKIVIFLSMIVIINASVASASMISLSSDKHNHIDSCEEKEWTWLFYDDADFNMAFDPLEDFATEVTSRDNVNVLILQDTFTDSTKLWYVQENHELELIEDLGELSMGSPDTLEYFIDFAQSNYPSNRIFLSVYNHGAGWMGCCSDDTDKDVMSTSEMQEAFENSSDIDILCFTAPCLMAAIESAYQYRNCVDVYIGSEEISGYTYWFGTCGKIVQMIDENLEFTNDEIGSKIIDLLFNQVNKPNLDSKRSKKMITMSAVKTSKLETAILEIDSFSKSLKDIVLTGGIELFKMKIIRRLTQSFYKYFKFQDGQVKDIYDFAKKCRFFYSKNQDMQKSIDNLLNALDDAILNNINGKMHPNAHGLSIFFPKEDTNLERYKAHKLDFVENTNWDEFLEEFLQK